MADGTGMRVDLSAMDEVIRKLWGLLDDMDKAGSTAKYNTEIPKHALGHDDFMESAELHTAHTEMKFKVESTINLLHGLIKEFGTNTSAVRDKYNDQEGAVKNNMGGNSEAPRPKNALSS
ncbi:hypothetical protein [Streptomyces sp. NPDC051569]|uniref:hypothetical protein n=1 Tax=Streptomyces sp. NPDC051569 TaxID=3365661 RepID=UPI00378C0CC0